MRKRIFAETKGVWLLFLLFIFLLYSLCLAGGMNIYTWETCVKTALSRNPDILCSRELIRQKKSSLGVTRSSLFPEISVTGSGERSSRPTVGDSEITGDYSYGLSAKQLLFDGFKSVYELKGAKADINTALYDYSVTSADVRLDLKKAYVALQKSGEMLKILKEIRGRRKHVMDLVKMKYDSGTEHRGSYYSAQADYLQSGADVKSGQRELLLTEKTLSYLMGMDKSLDFTVKGSMTLEEYYDEKPDFPLLAARHPSFFRAMSAVKSAMLNLKASEQDLSPKVYGTASAGRTGDSLDRMKDNWTLGFEISAPLVHGGEKWFNREKARSLYRQARFEERKVKNELMVELGDAWKSLMDSMDNVGVQKAALRAALERSKIGETRYSIGTLSFDNWTIIEDNLANRKRSYLEACAAALNAEALWIRATGGTLENESKK